MSGNVKSGEKLLMSPANPMLIFQVPFCTTGPDKEPAGTVKKAELSFKLERLGGKINLF